MKILAEILTLAVAALHFWFMALEMFLWKKPIGLKTFRMTAAQAEESATLAANQGLYNGFLAAGLALSFFLQPDATFTMRIFLLACVTVAGAFGAWSVSKRILYIQAAPAAAAIAALLAS